MDTHYLSDDIYAKCPGIIAALAKDSRYANLTDTLVGATLKKSKRVFDTSKVTAMETAGKFVDDDTLRAALKENGIGRPSSRANIIEYV